MRLAEGKTYKEYYVIIEKDGILRNIVASKGITKLGYMDEGNILIFDKKKNAKEWIEKHSYKGMSVTYIISKIWNCRETKYRWEIKSCL